MYRKNLILMIFLSLSLSAILCMATGEKVDWQVMSVAGESATSTNFTHNGTSGQTTIGRHKTNQFVLNSGFQLALGSAGFSCCLIPGDVNEDGSTNIGDAVYMINHVLKGGPPPDCLTTGDVNNDGSINIGDAVFLINFVQKGGDFPKCSSQM